MILESGILHQQLSDFDKALVTATQFGFLPIIAPKITKRDFEITRNCGDDLYYDATEKAAFVRTYIERGFNTLPHPLALAYKRPIFKKRLGGYVLHFIGSTSGFAEASLIRAAFSILTEDGHKSLVVEANCIGDQESINTYERELLNYMRKYGANLPDDLKQNLKEDVFNLFRLNMPEMLHLRETAPSAMTFLSTSSRNYFKEVLEYIEALGIEFRLVPELVGERHHSSHTIFLIKDTTDDSTLAVGYRYSRLARLFGLRKEIPMAGVTIMPAAKNNEHGRVYKGLPKPKFYLVQLGPEAKIKTLSLIELLRSHRIPVYHFIGKDKLTVQLLEAENLRVPYLIIIGQKEALSNTVTIRNITTRAQDTIDIVNLPHYLKHITL